MKTFKDLEFKPHRIGRKNIQAYIEFENKNFISVIGGPDFYGDGLTSFEIMSSVTKKTAAGVKGWQSIEQINRAMKYLQKK